MSTSALKLTGSFDEFEPRGPAWIDLAVASERSDLSIGQLRRRCQEWQRSGHARKAEPGEEDVGNWRVREDADPRLAAVKDLATLNRGFDLRQIADRHRVEVTRRKAAVEGWDEAMAAGRKLDWTEAQVSTHYVSRLKLETPGFRVSRRTLYNWRRDYRRDGLRGLCNQAWLDAGEQIASGSTGKYDGDPWWECAKRLWLLSSQPKADTVYDHAKFDAELNGWTVPVGKRQFRRLIAEIPRGESIRKREGDKAFVDKLGAYVERDYAQLSSNDLWWADHHRFDVLVTHEGREVRPWLTAWMDARSRRIVGYSIFVGDPSSDEVLGSFRNAVVACGVPSTIYIDNGKDFDSRAVTGLTKAQRRKIKQSMGDTTEAIERRGVMPSLGVTVKHALPYNARAKTVERFFRTVKERFCKFIDGYVGGSIGEKPHDLAKIIKGKRLLTLAELSEAFDEWVEGDYHDRVHQGDGLHGRTPRRCFDEELESLRTTDRELLDYLCCRRYGPVRVGRQGVTFNRLNYGQHDVRLQRMIGEQVLLVIDERDVTSVTVEQLDGKIVTRVQSNRRISPNAPAADLKAALADKRKDDRIRKQASEQRARAADDVADRMVRMAAERRAAAAAEADRNPPQPPSSVQPVGTRAADDFSTFKQLERAMAENRRAVGAEAPDLQAALDAASNRPRNDGEARPFRGLTYTGGTDALDHDGTDAGSSRGDDAAESRDILDLMRRAAESRGEGEDDAE